MLETIDAIIENLDTNEPEALLESIEILKKEVNKIRPYIQTIVIIKQIFAIISLLKKGDA